MKAEPLKDVPEIRLCGIKIDAYSKQRILSAVNCLLQSLPEKEGTCSDCNCTFHIMDNVQALWTCLDNKIRCDPCRTKWAFADVIKEKKEEGKE